MAAKWPRPPRPALPNAAFAGMRRWAGVADADAASRGNADDAFPSTGLTNGRQNEIDGMSFSDPRHRDADIAEEATVQLDQAAPFAKTRFRYEYDFGDGWEHEILVEAVQPPEPGEHYPLCLAGERAAPPEDSGGIWRYDWMLESLANPRDPVREELLDWLGGPIDPEAFDLKAVNRRLAGMR